MRKYIKYVVLAVLLLTVAGEIKRAIGETAFACLIGGGVWAIILWEVWLKNKF